MLGRLYPVDMKEEKPEVLEAAAQEYYAKLLEQPSSAAEFFSIPGREKVKLEASLLRFLLLYRQDSNRTLLVLNDPQRKDTVLAIYLHNSWWPIEDIVKTADLSREGLKEVQTFGEKIVLFVLNCIIFGTQERSLPGDAGFMPHSEKERAKLFWRSGEAAAFYTLKAKGSLCDEHSSQCYRLPVLDTVFVRKKFRRRGLGIAMLEDFCETFANEDALGISCPVSAEMYQDDDLGHRTERPQGDEPGQSGDSQMDKGAVQVPNIWVSPDRAEQFRDDREELPDLQPGVKEDVGQRGGEVHGGRELEKRVRRGGPTEDRAPKHLKAVSSDRGRCS